MANGTSSSKPSFSRSQKWRIGFHVTLAVAAVFAVVVMMNYLGGRYSKRFYTSGHYAFQLSPRTVSVVNSLTNPVQITLYYNRSDVYYGMLIDLLRQYQATNPKMIRLQAVDYIRDTGPAMEAKTNYKLGAATNLVIFAVEGRPPFIVVGDELIEKQIFQVKSEREDALAFDKKEVGFNGETKFTAALLAVSNPKPLRAYYLMGDGEHPVDQSDESYLSFLHALQEQRIQLARLLMGTNDVPMDCNLLIIAGPTDPLTPTALEGIDHYLNEGGRLFVLFNNSSVGRDVGLEKVLARWGVKVGNVQVVDPDLTSKETPGADILVVNFGGHPSVNPLVGRTVRLIQPRAIRTIDLPSPAGDERKAIEIAHAGPRSYPISAPASPEPNLPLMVAVEQTAKGVPLHERGATRILVVGDSRFLNNLHIGEGANSAFGTFAVNWLVERSVLLEVGSRPVDSYRILLTGHQMQSVQWILLAGVPGAVLLFGGLIWLRRRK